MQYHPIRGHRSTFSVGDSFKWMDLEEILKSTCFDPSAAHRAIKIVRLDLKYGLKNRDLSVESLSGEHQSRRNHVETLFLRWIRMNSFLILQKLFSKIVA